MGHLTLTRIRILSKKNMPNNAVMPGIEATPKFVLMTVIVLFITIIELSL